MAARGRWFSARMRVIAWLLLRPGAAGVNPDGTAQGPRSPLVIVSPFAKPGFTDTTATTFAGILGFTECNFGLTPLGRSDAQAYSFTNAFNFHQAPLRPARLIYRKWPRDAYHVNLAEGRDDT